MIGKQNTKKQHKSNKNKSQDKVKKVILVSVIVSIVAFFGTLATGVVKGIQTTKPDPVITTQQAADTVSLPAPSSQVITYAPPASNLPLYVQPASAPAKAYAAATGDQKNLLAKIANTPMGIWQTKGSSLAVYQQTMADAFAKDKVPIVVFYSIPKIGCGGGGSANLEAYKQWVLSRTASITAKTIVILEPDAMAMFDCLNGPDKIVRVQAMQFAVDTLATTPALTYIDAGHSSWVNASTMAENLKQVNVLKTRGISVNVSNFQTNADSAAYAQSVLSNIGGNLGVVIDSSRNGNGAPADKAWCNALGRKLGTPSAIVDSGIVDAYLWIKVPGESDGQYPGCNNSPVSEGQFWLDYALGLAS